MEDRFWSKYKDQGLEVVAIDPNGDDPAGVQAFVGHSGATYPIGLEDKETPTYKGFTKNFKGLNPYPVDVIVGKDGNVVYVGREYDPAAMQAVIEAELAKQVAEK
jgi:hypothetical protein